MVDPKTIPPAESGPLDIGSPDEMRDRAARYRGEAEGVDEAAAALDEQDEDFADLEG